MQTYSIYIYIEQQLTENDMFCNLGPIPSNWQYLLNYLFVYVFICKMNFQSLPFFTNPEPESCSRMKKEWMLSLQIYVPIRLN